MSDITLSIYFWICIHYVIWEIGIYDSKWLELFKLLTLFQRIIILVSLYQYVKQLRNITYTYTLAPVILSVSKFVWIEIRL